MKPLSISIALVIFLTSSFAQAESVHALIDGLDDLTDERSLMVSIGPEGIPPSDYGLEGTPLSKYMIMFKCDNGGVRFAAFSEVSSRIRPDIIEGVEGDFYIQVTYRFDKNPAQTEIFFWRSTIKSNGAIRNNAEYFLSQAIKSERMLVKIGTDNVMRYDLLSARDDLIEFKKRCEAW